MGACVLGAEHRPIAIGRLQRYATDHVFDTGAQVFEPAPPTGKRVAVVGAGPAGLSAAGELAKRGVHATVFERNELPGGLSTYGIVVLREPTNVSLEEVEFIKGLGVDVRTNVEVGVDVSHQELIDGYDAVVIAAGTGPVPPLGVPGEELEGVIEALPFIAATKIADKDGREGLLDIPVGNEVIVVGAGNTAVDAATVAKRLGAERSPCSTAVAAPMTAYDFDRLRAAKGSTSGSSPSPSRSWARTARSRVCAACACAWACPTRTPAAPEPVAGSEFVLPATRSSRPSGRRS